MPAPRTRRVRCAIVANVTFILTLAVAACRDDVAGGPTGAGATGGTGAAGSSGASVSCSSTGTGCLCIANDAQPGQLTDCSPTSVVENDMEKGVCCVAQALCSCVRYTCRADPASSYCQCGPVSTLATVTVGSPVVECPAPAAGQKCCFSQDNASCICSRLACAAEETEVPACSAAAAGACPAGEDIPACR